MSTKVLARKNSKFLNKYNHGGSIGNKIADEIIFIGKRFANEFCTFTNNNCLSVKGKFLVVHKDLPEPEEKDYLTPYVFWE